MAKPHSARALFVANPDSILLGTWDSVRDLLLDHKPSVTLGLIDCWGSLTTDSGDFRDFSSVDRLALGASDWPQLSPEDIQSFCAFSQDQTYGSFLTVALKLLNRKDMTGTFRLLEREVIVQSAVLQSLKIFETRKPGLLVFSVTPHEFLPFVLYSAANWLGIPVLFFQPCAVAPAMIPRKSLRQAFVPQDASVAASSVADHVVAAARAGLRPLIEGSDPIYIEMQKSKDRRVFHFSNFFRVLLSTIRSIKTPRFPNSIDFSGHTHRESNLARLGGILLGRSLQISLQQAVDRLGHSENVKCYSVFALHYEPERTSIPEGLPIYSMGDAIVQARAILPMDQALVVKEHYSQTSSAMRGTTGRSPLLYDLIQTLPNTFFASTATRLSDLVVDAQSVFTLTGTVAIEAVLRGTPVYFFGSPWWEGLPGTTRINQDFKYPVTRLIEFPNVEEICSFVVDLCRSAMVPGLAGERMGVIEERLGVLPTGFSEAEARSITMCITSCLFGESSTSSTSGRAPA